MAKEKKTETKKAEKKAKKEAPVKNQPSLGEKPKTDANYRALNKNVVEDRKKSGSATMKRDPVTGAIHKTKIVK